MSLQNLPQSCVRWLLTSLDTESLLTIHIALPSWRTAQEAEAANRLTLSVIIGDTCLALQMALIASTSALDTNIVTESPERLLLPEDRKAKRILQSTIEQTIVSSYSFDQRKVNQWTATFPNITKLNVIIRQLAPNDSLELISSSLISFYANQLTSLSLWVLYQHPRWINNNRNPCLLPLKQALCLVEAINRCQQLEELEIHLHNDIADIEKRESGEESTVHLNLLPVLQRLQKFSFFSKEGFSLIADSLLRLLSSGEDESEDQTLPLKIIEYGNSDLMSDLPSLLRLPPALANRFTHLSRAFTYSITSLPSFCRLFTFLRSLRVELSLTSNLKYCKLIGALAPLGSTLKYLELSLREFTDPLGTLMCSSDDDHQHTHPLPNLSSVQVLLIRLHVPSHDLLTSFHLTSVFPSLSRLQLEVIRNDKVAGCSTCGYTDYRTTSDEVRAKCHTQLLDCLLQLQANQSSTLRVVRIPPYTEWFHSEEVRREEMMEAARNSRISSNSGSSSEESSSSGSTSS